MYIDFHTHAFADKIAEKAMGILSETAGTAPCTDGTLKGLKDKLRQRAVDAAVVLPVATKPSQHEIINKWAAVINGRDGIYAFGSVYPGADDALYYLERIKADGLYGVKLHPDYQNFFVDDERAFPVYQKCIELELPVLFHAGYDPLSPDITHAAPDGLLRVHEAFPELTMIIAHLGGMYRWELVERLLAGRPGNVYFDTAVIAGKIDREQLIRIIAKHGADRILLGSDCPWDDPAEEIAMINNLPIPNSQKELIFYKNAQKLLGIAAKEPDNQKKR